jgi:hypothetical protein
MYEVEFRKEVGTAIPLLVTLLNSNHDDTRSSAVSALAKMANHGEPVVVHYPQILNACIKASFGRKLGQPFLP